MGGNTDESRSCSPLPPSCKYVLDVLDRADGEISRQELLEVTELPEDTLDDALKRLENHDFIDKTRKNGDLRQVVVVFTST